jgi:AcrR family transcriptional regulator
VARQTFYNHVGSKEALFVEVIWSLFNGILSPLIGHPVDLRKSLLNFAQIYRQRALSPEGIAAYRILICQAQRFPDLVKEVYAMGTEQMIKTLANLLRVAMDEGIIRHGNSVFAAELLMAMLLGQERSQLLLGVRPPHEEDPVRVAAVVDGFLQIMAHEQKPC